MDIKLNATDMEELASVVSKKLETRLVQTGLSSVAWTQLEKQAKNHVNHILTEQQFRFAAKDVVTSYLEQEGRESFKQLLQAEVRLVLKSETALQKLISAEIARQIRAQADLLYSQAQTLDCYTEEDD